MNYEQALQYLDGLMKFGIKFGLDRIGALCEAFDNPQQKLRVIHVAGTNGKGSTSTFIASILREAGYRAGLYLSPYVYDVRERIQINGRMIGKEEFALLVTEIAAAAEDIAKTDLGPVTEFEVKTMMAYLYFARQGVDFAVLEVGMGGRFDATNLVQPLVAVITNVSLDHMERLGDTVEKIAFEKAGIIKTGSIVVTAAQDERAWSVILDKCREAGAEVWRVLSSTDRHRDSRSADVHMRYSSAGTSFSISGNETRIANVRPGLAGSFQHANAATAIAAVLALRRYEVRIPSRAISLGIANAYIPGRLEILQDNPKLIIDGAHNTDAAHTLAHTLQESFRYDNLILVVGMINTHPSREFLSYLAPMAVKVIATQSTWLKASPAREIAESAEHFCGDVEVVDKVPDAVARALEVAEENDLILVTGSFYTIGEVR